MKLCEETITVFNARLDEETGYDVYIPTVIRGVSWYSTITSNVDSSGLNAANMFIIRIPVDADFSEKGYTEPVDYPESDPDSFFTLQQGDIIVHHAVTERMSPAALKEQYGEIVTILGVTDNRRALNAKHWKVVGK